MRSYGLYIGGEDRDGRGWTYAIRASELLAEPERAFNLKRELELGDRRDVPPEVIGRCALGTEADNADALKAARAASGEFARMPLAVRRRIVAEWVEEIDRRADELVDLLVAEGHPRKLAQWEVSGVIRGADEPTLDWYVEMLERDFESDGKRLRLVRKPDGVVCVNPPQNAAGSNSALGVLAILAGNSLVVKAPRSTPLSVMFVYRDVLAPVLERHGAPPGTLNLISGDTRQILRQWIRSPLVDDVLFFGDSATGLKIGSDCVANGKKPILELSGNDALVVWRDADLDAAARALTECFYGSSQICMVPKHAIVHPDVADGLLDRLLRLVEGVRPGYPEDPDVLLSPVLKTDRFFDFLAEAREAGCEILTGGERVDVDGRPSATGFFFEPTVVRVEGLEDARSLSCVREETFFPMLPVVVAEPADDETMLERIVAFMNANEYGLRNSVWARDERLLERFAGGLVNGGLLKLNDSHIGFVSYLSTHGGNGKTGGPYGELNYVGLRTTHMQGVVWGTGDPQPFADRFRERTAPPFDELPAPAALSAVRG